MVKEKFKIFDKSFQINLIIYIDAKINSRNCEVRNIDVHGASYAKRLKSKYHLENEMVIPEWLFQEPMKMKLII